MEKNIIALEIMKKLLKLHTLELYWILFDASVDHRCPEPGEGSHVCRKAPIYYYYYYYY